MTEPVLELTANRVDVVTGEIAPAAVLVEGGVIREIRPAPRADGYLLPGFVDAHVHIESSMLLPSQFARAAVVHGTLATVSDPHEIANVCGLEGIELMLRDAARTCFRFHFGAPSCVPATVFETAGAVLDADDVSALLEDPRIGYLSEMMDFPGVLSRSETVMAKIAAARSQGKPVDGHAPGLRGDSVVQYVSAGITTDHECVNREEGIDRIRAGCRVAIREGSAARNFDALQSLIGEYPDDCMLCSDDKHPDELLLGHINRLVARAVEAGTDPLNAIRAASLNPIRHYGLSLGLLQVGDPADFILTDDLSEFRVRAAYLAGREVARDGQSQLPVTSTETINKFDAPPIARDALAVRAESSRIRVIEATDGQLITGAAVMDASIRDGQAVADPDRDVLKLVVVNRYQEAPPAVAFVRGFGLRRGAIASSVAHDSHNIVAVGASDDELCGAINAIIANRGGLSVQAGSQLQVLPLPVAGLMATGSCETVAADYSRLDRQAKELGSKLRAPYMTLSFMALLVIPSLKLSDRGLFDGDCFEFVPLFA